MTNNNEIVPVEIFSGTQGEVDFLLSMLEDEEIQTYLKDEYAGTIVPYISPGGAAPITIVVSSEDADKAMEVVKEYLDSKEPDQ